MFKKIGLTTRIFLALVAGALFGHFLPDWAVSLKFIGDMFLNLIKLIVVPLIFSTLVIGIAGTGDFKKLGRLGLKAIIFFEIATTIALFLGLIAAHLLQPGTGVNPVQTGTSALAISDKHLSMLDFLVNIVPANIVAAMAKGDMLQIVVFSVLFGVAAAAVGKKSEPVMTLCNGVAEVMFKFTHFVMRLAPYGVFSFIAFTVGQNGIKMLLPLFKLVGSLYLSILVFLILLVLLCALIMRVNLFKLCRVLREAILLAFTTASSEAALPMTMERLEKIGVPKFIVSFVLPVGYSFNLCGSTLYCTLASMFIAQVYQVNLPWQSQLFMCFMFALSSKGIAGVPGASIMIIAGTGAAFGLPLEGIALIMGVDRIMDMARTVCNLFGNAVATVYVAWWENEISSASLRSALDKKYLDTDI